MVTIDYYAVKRNYGIRPPKYQNSYLISDILNFATSETCYNRITQRALQRLLELNEKSCRYREKYIQIREELVDIINKVYDYDKPIFNLNDYESNISEYALSEDDIMTCAFNIYHEIKNLLRQDIDRFKAREILNKFIKTELNFDQTDGLQWYETIIKTNNNEEKITEYLKKKKNIDNIKREIEIHNRTNQVQTFINQDFCKKNSYLLHSHVFFTNKQHFIQGKITYEKFTTNINSFVKKREREQKVTNMFDLEMRNYSWINNHYYTIKNLVFANAEVIDYLGGHKITKKKINETIKQIIESKVSTLTIEHKTNLIKRHISRNYRYSEATKLQKILNNDPTMINYINENNNITGQTLPQFIIKHIQAKYKEVITE